MISLILLASGFGRRFGSNKLLHPIDGKPMVQHIIEKLQHLNGTVIRDQLVTVTVVSQYEDILGIARQHGLSPLMNENAREGISASVKKGVECAEDAEWYAFFMGDQPYLKEETIRAFLTECLAVNCSMASACSEGEPGNPTLFHRRWRKELLQLSGDVGGRRIMKQHPDEVHWFEISHIDKKDIDSLT